MLAHWDMLQTRLVTTTYVLGTVYANPGPGDEALAVAKREQCGLESS